MTADPDRKRRLRAARACQRNGRRPTIVRFGRDLILAWWVEGLDFGSRGWRADSAMHAREVERVFEQLLEVPPPRPPWVSRPDGGRCRPAPFRPPELLDLAIERHAAALRVAERRQRGRRRRRWGR